MDNDSSQEQGAAIADEIPAQSRAVISIGTPIVIALGVFAVYSRVCHADFILLDDDVHIFLNPFYQTSGHLSQFWRAPYENLYIPVAYTLMGLLAPFGRLPFPNASLTSTGAIYNPHFFHTVSLVLHMVNVVLVYALLLLIVKREGAAAVGALVFAFHPFQVESVAWISEFRGLFAGVFSLAGLVAYVLAVRTTGSARVCAYAGWASAAILAVLCKPSAVSVPIIAFVIDSLLLRRSWRPALAGTLPLLLVFVPLVRFTSGLQPEMGTNYVPVWLRPLIATDAVAFYCVKFAMPFNMILDYGRQPERVLHSGVALWSWGLPVVVALAVWKLRRRLPWLPGAALVALAAIAPVAGLVPFRFQDLSTVADRYMYLAMLGPAIAVAYLWADAQPVDARAGIAVILLAWVCLSMHQLRYWDNSVSVFTHSLRINPNSTLIECNLGLAYQHLGDTSQALEHYDRSIALDPNLFGPRLNRANLLQGCGNYAAAIGGYQQILAIWPKSRMAPLGIGRTYEYEGKFDDALQVYRRLVAGAPDFEPARVRLGVMFLAKQQYGLAQQQFLLALKSDPYDAEAWTGLGNVASVAGNTGQAIDAYSRSASLDPTGYEADYDLGVLLLRLSRFDQALKSLRDATASRPGDADAHDMLGVALFDTGDRTGALREFQSALKCDPHHQGAMSHLASLYTVR